MIFNRLLFLLFLLPHFTIKISAQDHNASHKLNIVMPEVALLSLVSEGSLDVEIYSNSPVEAGSPIHFDGSGQAHPLWINYSSIIRDPQHRRKIVAFIQGELPEGMQLLVEASAPQGSGNGKLGQSNGSIVLTGQPSEIISDIGSCYTGKGLNQGHSISYKLECRDENTSPYASARQGQSAAQIIYTLTDVN